MVGYTLESGGFMEIEGKDLLKYYFDKLLIFVKYYFNKIIMNTLIILFMLLLGYAYIYNFYQEKYVSNTTFMMGVCVHECVEESHLNVEFNKKVLFDYMELLKSDLVLDKANKLSNLNYSIKELRDMVDISYEENTEYIIITVTSNNQWNSSKLSINLYNALKEEIIRIFDIDNIHLVDSDKVGYLKIDVKLLLLINLVVALIVSIIVSVIRFIISGIIEKKKKINKKTVKRTRKK